MSCIDRLLKVQSRCGLLAEPLSTQWDMKWHGYTMSISIRCWAVASVWADRQARKWSEAGQVVDIESAGWRASACQGEAEDCTRTVWNDMHIMVWGTPGDVQP